MTLPTVEYLQVAMEGLEPTLLSEEAMRAKLAELGIEPTSRLGKHALEGGKLASRGGVVYQLESAATKTCGHCNEPMTADTLTSTNEDGVPVHWDCLGLTPIEARARVQRQPTSHAAGNESKTPLDLCADLYCGVRAEDDTNIIRIGSMLVRTHTRPTRAREQG